MVAPVMSTVSINLTIDRHKTGNTRIHGKIGQEHHDVNVWKGPQPGDAYVEGNQAGEPTTLRINSAFSEVGHKVFGRVAGVAEVNTIGGLERQYVIEPDLAKLAAAGVTLDFRRYEGLHHGCAGDYGRLRAVVP